MKSDPARTPQSRRVIFLALLTAVTGFCISLHFRSRIAQTEATEARLTAETLRLNTEQELTLFAEVLESVRALHALSDAVDQAAMDEFIEKGLVHQHTVLGPFGLAQKISPHVRRMLEKEAAEQGTGYRVVTQGANETWVPSEPKAACYPLTWQSRTEGLNIPIGFDFSSSPKALRTIKQIEQTRQTALVPAAQKSEIKDQRSDIENFPILHHSHTPPLPHHSPAPSYWVFAPVVHQRFQSSPLHTPDNVIGFAVAKLDPEAVVKRVAARSSLSPELHLDLINPENFDSDETIRRSNKKWIYRHPLEAMGAQWMFECSLPISITGHRSLSALIFGLIITAFMTSQLLILGNRTRKIEAEVRARTEELHLANAALEKNLRERARMEEELNELTARERRRIGRDLHDSLGQKLAGAVFLSRSLLDYFLNNRGQEAGVRGQGSGKIPVSQFPEHARTLNETLKSAVAQVRKMARGLAPVALNDESLGEALKQLAEEMTALYDVSCELSECDDLPALNRKTKEQLYLIAREAVNNAARHAQAQHITIRLNNDEPGWHLRVEDDGNGLSATAPVEKALPSSESDLQGMGIRIMQHRARLIGAELTIHSTTKTGTCVQVVS